MMIHCASRGFYIYSMKESAWADFAPLLMVINDSRLEISPYVLSILSTDQR